MPVGRMRANKVFQKSSYSACHCEPVTDVTGVAPSRDSLRSQSVFPCLPLGWRSAQRIKIQQLPVAIAPYCKGGSRVPRKRETDEGYLPLPMGEVSRRGGEGMFTLSVTP